MGGGEFPRAYKGIRDLVRDTVLDLPTARAIVRKGGGRSPEGLNGPSFSADNRNAANADQYATDPATKLVFADVMHDSHGFYDPAQSRFTPAVPGIYDVSLHAYVFCHLYDQSHTGTFTMLIWKHGAGVLWNHMGVYRPTGRAAMDTWFEWREIRAAGMVEMNGTDDYLEPAFNVSQAIFAGETPTAPSRGFVQPSQYTAQFSAKYVCPLP